jgi:hypothetical protein
VVFRLAIDERPIRLDFVISTVDGPAILPAVADFEGFPDRNFAVRHAFLGDEKRSKKAGLP